jgi:hypothetical protein
MIRLTLFIIALLLVVDVIQPSGPWWVTMAVLSGIETFRLRYWFFGVPSPLSLTIFIVTLIFAVGAAEATDAWLVALAVLTGVEAFRPRHFGRRWWGWGWDWRWSRMRRAWAGSYWGDDYW